MKKPLIILTGPTAVGKTAISIQLAKAVGGEIISADSMQIYKYMDVGTAKIMPDEMEGVPHHLIDEITPDTPFHVYEFKKMAQAAMEQIYERGHIPIVTGGTGFYTQALLYDVDFCDEPADHAYRRELTELAEKKGAAYLHDMLRGVDERSAQDIHPHNIKRVIRALEYFHDNGAPISVHNAEQREKPSPYDFLYLVLTMDRQKLYARINERVDQMVRDGLFEETERLLSKGYTQDLVSMQAIGYKELFPFFAGTVTKEEAIEQLKKDTRHFAKRQLTWFRRERDVTLINKDEFESDDAVVREILSLAERKLNLGRKGGL